MPSITGVNGKSFDGYLAPADVQRIINLLIDGAPFARSLTRQPTNRNTVAYPTAAPSGFAWVNELDQIPKLTLNDDSYIVAVAKIAGILPISNESINDSTVNVTSEVGRLLGDTLSGQLDEGLLHGDGPPKPVGIVGIAPVADGDSLLTGVAAAVGSIADAGGTADTIAMSGTALATINTAVSSTGELLYPAGFGAALSLKPVAVPNLAETLVYDSTRLFTVINGLLSEVDFSDSFYFDYDARAMRVKTRIAVACPDPAKSIRKVTVTTPAP